MALAQRLLVAGGYGVFGRVLAAELLATTSARLVIAGRNFAKAEETCRSLDGAVACEPLALDLNDHEAFRRAVSGCFAVICAAGPFQSLDRELPWIAVETGAHWLDISDHEAWVISLLEREGAARAARRIILPGLSSVPALSGVLVRWAKQRLPEGNTARITLSIGNRNRKGAGSIASVLDSELDHPIPVTLPTGRRMAHRFRSPDRFLLKKELGLDAEVRVAFESSLANWLLPRLRAMGVARAARARLLSRLAAPFDRFGSDLSYLQAELFSPGGRSIAAWFLAKGQRLAILPAALAIEALLRGELGQGGCLSPADLLPAEDWIARLSGRGIRFGTGEKALGCMAES